MLLDEVEKAHAEVIDLVLPAFDEGYLVDGRGVRHACSTILFVMTSNLGSSALSEWIRKQSNKDDLGIEQVQTLVTPHVRKHLRPELLGRVDGIAFFTPLSSDDIRAITCMQLEQLRNRFHAATESRCTLVCNPSAVYDIMKSALRPEHGARSIKRTLQITVAVPLAKLLLASSVRNMSKNCQLHIGLEESKLTGYVVPKCRL